MATELFDVGDLVYYKGFEIFEPQKRYIGVIVGHSMYAAGLIHYTVFWFDSCLTTRVHYSNILKVYDEKGRD